MSEKKYAATVGQLKELLSEYDDDQPLLGQAATDTGTVFNWPVEVVKMPGNNRRVVVLLAPPPWYKEEHQNE